MRLGRLSFLKRVQVELVRRVALLIKNIQILSLN
jgi:hypothetical protein